MSKKKDEHLDSWHSDKWEMFLRNYRRLYSTHQSVDLLQGDNDTPEVKIDESSTKKASSDTIVDIQADREIKKGYSPNLGYYYNYINVDMFGGGTKTLLFDYKDMADAIAFGITTIDEGVKTLDNEDIIYLDEQLRKSPEAAIHGLREAVYRIMKQIHHEYAMELKDEFKARFKNMPEKISLAEITNKHIGSLYAFEGFVTAIDDATRLKYMISKWVCRDGHITEVEGRNRPPQCKYCNNRYLEEAPGGITETYQEFRLQQRHDQTKDGRIAVERDIVIVGDDIINSVQGGDYVELTGIVKVRENSVRKKNNDIADFYIEASYVERKSDDLIMIPEKDSLFLEEEVKDAVHPGSQAEDIEFEKLSRSIAPSVKGHDLVKQVLLLQAASSDSKTFEDGTPHRGHICILFCGSPATAKTVLANYVRKIHIRSVMPTGEGLSKAGLTAAVDTKVSPPRLYPGAYLMAKNGIVIIDEVQTLKQDILDAILEVIEDAQTVTITKAGIHRPLKADCASLHLCNPKATSYWDDTKDIMENTGFKANLLSRYDAVIVFRDIPDIEEDKEKADHWTRTYAYSKRDYEKDENKSKKLSMKSKGTMGGLYTPAYMAMWLRYVRKAFHPVLEIGSDAYIVIQNFYLNFRKTDARYFAQGAFEGDEIQEETKQKIPSITMRQLSSLYRIAEASARACHRNKVEVKDAQRACEIMRFSILNSGFNPISKQAVAKEIDATGMSSTPRYREIDIMKMATQDRDKFYEAAKRKFQIFEHTVVRTSIGRCLYCKGTGVGPSGYGKCNDCQAFGCTNEIFTLGDIEPTLFGKGVNRNDINYMAAVFEKLGLLTKDEYDRYKVLPRYSFSKGYRGIKMASQDIQTMMELAENMEMVGMVYAGMSKEDREKMQREVEEDLSDK